MMIRIFTRKISEKKMQHMEAEQLLIDAGHYLGWPEPIKYEKKAAGKPYLLPPNEQIYMNWSHSGAYVLLAIADREIGVDLQTNGKVPTNSLVRRVLQPEEQAYYESQKPERKQQLFYEYWALKESFLKTLGTGFHTSLADFQIQMGINGPRISQNVDNRSYSCRLLDFPEEGYTAAVCWEGNVELENIEIEYLPQEGTNHGRNIGCFKKMDR
jgi:phosphopantetheine--protein transferase-like protein